MDQPKIQLRKIRTFGDCISDAFQLLRTNGKSLFKSFILISGVFILLTSILNGINQRNAMQGIFGGASERITTYPFSTIFTSLYIVVMVLVILTIVVMNVVIAVYYKLYAAGNEQPTFEEVWRGFLQNIVQCFFSYIVVAIIIALGIVLCIIPGVYFAVSFTPFIFVMVTEETSFSDTFSRCFKLTTNNFWSSFGLYFVTYMIVAVLAGSAGLILSLITGFGSYFTTKDVSKSFAIGYSVFSGLSYVTYIILFMVVGMQYYSLAEKLDGTGMLQRLDSLGSHQDDYTTQIEEEF